MAGAPRRNVNYFYSFIIITQILSCRGETHGVTCRRVPIK